MPDFEVYYVSPDGGYNHCILSANYISEAVDYVESTKGGLVYQAQIRGEIPPPDELLRRPKQSARCL